MAQMVILSNGDRIIADVKSLKNDLKLTNPMKYELRTIDMQGTAVVLSSYVQYASSDPIKIKKSFVMSVTDIDPVLEEYYGTVLEYNLTQIAPALRENLRQVNRQITSQAKDVVPHDDFEDTLDRLGIDYISKHVH